MGEIRLSDTLFPRGNDISPTSESPSLRSFSRLIFSSSKPVCKSSFSIYSRRCRKRPEMCRNQSESFKEFSETVKITRPFFFSVPRTKRKTGFQGRDIGKNIGGNHQSVTRFHIVQPVCNLPANQLVINFFGRGFPQHSGRQINAFQTTERSIFFQENPAKPGTASGIENPHFRMFFFRRKYP